MRFTNDIRVVWVALFCVGCGGNADPEKLRSITQGVYGKTTYFDDVCSNGCSSRPHAMSFTVESVPQGLPVASITSSSAGFYEAPLEPGNFKICTLFGRCTDFTVASNQVVRRDYEMSAGPGWSQ